MGRMKRNPEGRMITSVSISPEFHRLCYTHNISFSEALRVGIAITLAEKGVREYDNNLSIVRRMNLFRQKAEESLAKVYELEAKFKEKQMEKEDDKKRVDFL